MLFYCALFCSARSDSILPPERETQVSVLVLVGDGTETERERLAVRF